MVDPAPALQAIADVVSGLGGVRVYVGVPESLAAGVNAYVALGAWDTAHRSGGLLEHAIQVSVTFGYRVAGQEAGVETALATKVGAFIAAYLPKLRNQLDGTVYSTDRPSFTLSGEPEYALVAGTEHRLFRGTVPIVLQEIF